MTVRFDPTDPDPDAMTPRLRQDHFRRLRERLRTLKLAGWICLVAGALAIVFPFLTSISLSIFAGTLLALAGGILVWTSFSHSGVASIAASLLIGLLTLAFGIAMIVFPIVGLVWLTVVLAAYLLAEGLTKLWQAYKLRPDGAWGWMLASGLVSLALGLLIAIALPGVSLTLILKSIRLPLSTLKSVAKPSINEEWGTSQ